MQQYDNSDSASSDTKDRDMPYPWCCRKIILKNYFFIQIFVRLSSFCAVIFTYLLTSLAVQINCDP